MNPFAKPTLLKVAQKLWDLAEMYFDLASKESPFGDIISEACDLMEEANALMKVDEEAALGTYALMADIAGTAFALGVHDGILYRNKTQKWTKKKDLLADAINAWERLKETGVPFPLVSKQDVDEIRQKGEKTWRDYGVVESKIATGRAYCRSCGEKIAKGEPVWQFAEDFHGSGSWTAVTVYIHQAPCIHRGSR